MQIPLSGFRGLPIIVVFIFLALAGMACEFVPASNPPPTQVQAIPDLVSAEAVPTDIPILIPTVELPTAVPPTLIVEEPPAVPVSGVNEELFVEIYNQINPAVVAILIHDSFGQSSGQATGFVFDEHGHIVTNQHVVVDAASIEVTFPSGEKMWADLLGSDEAADLAVVKVPALPAGVSPVTLADSDLVSVGQRVVAIGNPFGFESTITTGIVSGLGRVLQSEALAPGGGSFSAPDVIQTDAAINPGNSGGPLINMQGQVIGVNKAIFSETGVNSGIGFAIASNTVRRVAPSLILNGSYTYPFLGLSSRSDLTLREIEILGLPSATGVYILTVVAGGPADQAGIRGGSIPTNINGLLSGGDFITAIDGNPVRNFSEMLSYLVNHTEVGQTVTVTVLRNGTPEEIGLTLGARP